LEELPLDLATGPVAAQSKVRDENQFVIQKAVYFVRTRT
jgi:hypothetical protein